MTSPFSEQSFAEIGSSTGQSPHKGLSSAQRLLSLDSLSLSALDRSISGVLGSAAVEIVSTSPLEGVRMMRVRPSGLNLDALGSLARADSQLSRNNSTLFELAEEQVQLLASMNASEGAESRLDSVCMSPSNLNSLCFLLGKDVTCTSLAGSARSHSPDDASPFMLSISEPATSSAPTSSLAERNMRGC
jgi:hypothetical protein